MISNYLTKKSFIIALTVFLFISLFIWVGAKGCVQWSNDDKNTTTGTSASLIGIISNLSISAENSSTITINWTESFINESGFNIERKPDGGSYSLLALVPANTVSYMDTGLTDGTTYYYRVKAYNLSFESAYSDEISTMTYGIWTSSSITATTPSSRTNHTALWADSLGMIVWGGINGQNTLYTGGIYSSTVDTWSSITTTSAPASRTAHTAVWTGSKMIVWGGYTIESSATQIVDTCEITWTASTPNITTDISTDKQQGTYSASIDIATPFTTEMIAYRSLPAPLNISARTTVTFWIKASSNIQSGVLSFIIDDDIVFDSPLESLTINTTLNAGAWTLVTLTLANPALLTGIQAIGLKAISDPGAVTILIDDIQSSGGGTTYYNSGGVYNPANNTWSVMSLNNAPDARAYHSAIWTGSRMIIWGGKSATAFNDGGVYNPEANEWITGNFTNLIGGTHVYNPLARSQHMALWTGSGSETWRNQMLIWGGESGGTSGALYDPALDIWSTINSSGAPSQRWGFSSVWTGSGTELWRNKLIVWGGYNGTERLRTGAIYDPTLNAWTTLYTSGAPTARMYHTGVWTGTKMIIWGGDGSNQEGGVYDPSNGKWMVSSTTNAPAARIYHSAVWDNGRKMIIWGGWNGVYYFASGGLYTSE
jgi:hypothetical protein